MRRRDAYRWLAWTMEVPQDKAHIGWFTEEQCERLVSIMEEVWRPKQQ